MRYLVALMMLSALVATAMADEQVYKWTDDTGQVHYGAMPPPGRTAERIQVDTGSPAPPPPTAAAEKPKTAAGDAEPKETAATDAAASAEQCDIARNNLETLTQGGSDRRFRTPDGEMIRFTPKELQAQIEENRAFLDEHCQG